MCYVLGTKRTNFCQCVVCVMRERVLVGRLCAADAVRCVMEGERGCKREKIFIILEWKGKKK